MRILWITASALLIGPCSHVRAEDPRVITEAPLSTPTSHQALDQLFTQLKRERDPEKARGISDQIRTLWNDSGSATINLMMQWADTAVTEKRTAAAFDFLDQITILKPDYIEGWNRRATLYYALGEPKKSMADINEVLRLEPRQFGALAGMASILTEAGRDAQALEVWERFLDIYPAEREAQEQVRTLSEKLAGNRT